MLSLADIRAAHAYIRPLVRQTPIKRSATLSETTGTDLHLKLENFQRTGSFKVRGALWKTHNLTDDEKRAGVVAASAGNHAQGVAYAARHEGVAADIFMPSGASHAKAMATKGYGAHVHLVGRDYQEAYEHAVNFQEEHGKAFVHAYDDPFIMAGQGTVGLEILQEVPDVDTVVVPIGGGGLIGGVAAAIKLTHPDARIIGVQAEGASTVAESLDKGDIFVPESVNTMADGIACRRLGSRTFAEIRAHMDSVVTVTEDEISRAILWLLERTKVTVEGAGAVTLAACMNHGQDLALGDKAVAIVSGGNIDMTLLGRIIQQGLVKEGRIAVLETTIPDTPGEIQRLLALLAQAKGNVLDIIHDRLRHDVPLHQTHVQVHMETRGPDHADAIGNALRDAGYAVSLAHG